MAEKQIYKDRYNEKLDLLGEKIPTVKDLEWFLSWCVYYVEEYKDELPTVLKVSNWIKNWCLRLFQTQDDEYYTLYEERVLLFESRYLFDSYLLYLERKRPMKDKFYQPKRECFMKLGVIQALQDMEDDKLDILSISMPPGTGKTTLEKFFATWVIGRHPQKYSLFFSHSGDITRMFYDGVLDICTSTEYTWGTVFQGIHIKSTNAKAETINFDKYKPFANLQCTSVGSNNSGKVRANCYLYCDDLIGGIEQALNKSRLDNLWNIYSTDARQRKVPGCKEIHIATRWSVHDVIGRLQRIYENDTRCKFIAIPDIDKKTHESNFNYAINGFDEKFFSDQALTMDEVSYQCLYKNEPIEREGLLYTDDSIRRYMELPDKEPDAIIGVCDAKGKGTDYMVLPCFYQYGEDYYLVDCVCDNDANYDVQYGKIVDIIMTNNMQQLEIEANAGGDRIAYEVDLRIKELGARCNITSKPTETNKETRIIVNADWIKRHCLFKAKEHYNSKSDYGMFMSLMFSYSVAGRNPVDDVPDALANFCLYATKGMYGAKTVVLTRDMLGF